MPGSFVCSGALKARLGAHDVERAMARRRPLRALFSGQQLRMLAARLPRQAGIDDLAVLGPVDARAQARPDRPGPGPARRAVDLSRRLPDPRAIDPLSA
jgi:hypothetical protein